MIQTDKYKKGIVALSRKAAEINPQLGSYQAHYITSNRMFMVQLSNGQLEVEIGMAREYEQGAEQISSWRLRRLVFPNQEFEEETPNTVNTSWRKLFAKQTKY